MKKQDNLSIIVTAALAEGLSYGKYIAMYNYDPPCLKTPAEGSSGADKPKKRNGYQPKPPKTRICPQCGKEFTAVRRIYCSTDCQYDHKKEKDRERGKKATAIRQENAAPRYCKICGEQIHPARNWKANTCSEKCANELKSRRRMERYYELIGVKDQMLSRLYPTQKNTDLPHDL